MKKLIPVASLSGLLFVIVFISISVRNNNTAFAAAPCKSCAKAADSGKKQSSSKKICSAITGILKNEIGKTKNKTKLDILNGGLDYANDVCDSGGSPDLAKITKGLPEKDKARISQKTNAALFDGAADRPDKDFAPNTSNTAATLTSKGGQVTDLKSAEPATPKLNAASEFSLSGKKLSAETPGQAATKQSSSLLASVASAKTPSDIPNASTETTLSPQKASAASFAGNNNYDDPTLYNQACIQAARTLCSQWGTAPMDQACLDREAVSCKISGGCPPGQVQTGTGCGCPPGTGQVLIGGKCACREGSGQIIEPTTGKCGCPVDTGQVLNPEGKCVCAPDYIFTIAKKCEPKNSDNGRHLTIDEMLAAQKIFGDKIPDCGGRAKLDQNLG